MRKAKRKSDHEYYGQKLYRRDAIKLSVILRSFCINYGKTIRRGSECGKTSGIDDFLHWDRNCDRYADRGKHSHYCHSRALPSLWLSYVLSVKLLVCITKTGTGSLPCLS